MKKIILPVISGICLLAVIASCKSGLSEEQEVFLDYAKLEDRYHNTQFYLNLDIHDDTIAAAEYQDAVFNLPAFTERIQRSFKLVKNNAGITPLYDEPALQYPHQYVISRRADSAYDVSMTLFVPEHFSSFTLTKKDIGKQIEKEEAIFELLDITNDAATVMITDKARRSDYDYTYDQAERRNLNKERDTSISKEPFYESGLFLSERIAAPNETEDFVKDSLLRIHFGRVNISLLNEAGKTLLSEGRINNFRHYLWYRNNDMPYEEMRGDYRDIQQRYKEADSDSMHRFNPIEIVNIRGRGKLAAIEIFIRSNKGKVTSIDLGRHVPKPMPTNAGGYSTYHPAFASDSNNIYKELKINYALLQSKKQKDAALLLYTSLPEQFKNLDINFEDVWLMGANDSMNMEMQNADNYLELAFSANANNRKAVKMLMPQMDIASIKGKLVFSTSGIYDTSFAVTALPASIKSFNNGLSFSFNREVLPVVSLRDIYGLKKVNGSQALTCEYDETGLSDDKTITLHFTEAPAVLVFRGRKDAGTEYIKSFAIPFVKAAL
ncbi:MAG: hypothetical protein EOO03_02285 [Chitinophagaceae bacterium]|nr:MAG: hypothetical protein EOO03_02285 [Chitinophagaceae bacterium]